MSTSFLFDHYFQFIKKGQNFISLFWVLSSFTLSLLYFFQNNHILDLETSIITFVLSSVSLILFFSSFKTEDPWPKEESSFPISKKVFFIGLIPLFFTSPLFENDHFRYLWEGRVLLSGQNPYLLSPSEINSIAFSKKAQIAYPEVATIYPPLALVYFSFFALFPYEWGLRLMMMTQSLMVWYVLKALWSLKQSRKYLIVSMFLLQKEFIQSVHVDLFCFFICFLPFFISKRDQGSRESSFSAKNSWPYLFVASFIKFIPLFFLFTHSRKIFISIVTSALISLTVTLLFFGQEEFFELFRALPGIHTFSTYWTWTPGFYSILMRFFDLPREVNRGLCLLCFFSVLVFLFWMKERKGQFQLLSIDEISLFMMMSLLFFSPVCNTWYFIWVLPFAWASDHPIAFFSLVSSFFCYLPQGGLHLAPLSELLVHMWYPLMWIWFFLQKKEKTKKKIQ